MKDFDAVCGQKIYLETAPREPTQEALTAMLCRAAAGKASHDIARIPLACPIAVSDECTNQKKGISLMILAISGSGRKNKAIHQAVQSIAERCGEPYEVVSLAGKKINGCIGCTACASDNECKVKDDWNDIGRKMLEADGIIFGAPNYYGTINALAHACLERTFCFRHRETLSLQGKFGISVTTSRDKNAPDPVRAIIERLMLSNGMKILVHAQVEGYDQCYTCGFGQGCKMGNVVKTHGVLEKIEEKHLPRLPLHQPEFMAQLDGIIAILKHRHKNGAEVIS